MNRRKLLDGQENARLILSLITAEQLGSLSVAIKVRRGRKPGIHLIWSAGLKTVILFRTSI